jgi:hypothetical protein
MNLLIVLLIILLILGVPNLGLHNYGWGPSGIVTILLVVLIVLALTGRLG